MLLERLGQPDAAARRRSSTASRGPRPGRGPRRGAGRARRAGRPALVHRGPGRRARPAPVRPLDLPRPTGHVYHETANPPQVAGICDIDGAPLIQRADDRPETIRARLAQQLPPLHEVVDYYREHGRPAARSTAGARSTTSTRGSLPGARRDLTVHGRRLMIVTLKSPSRDRADAPRRPDRGRGPRARRVGAQARRHDRPTSTASPRRTSARAGAVPSFKGYPAHPRQPFPASICISIDDEVVHGIPGDRGDPRRPDRVGRRRRDRRRLARRRARGRSSSASARPSVADARSTPPARR